MARYLFLIGNAKTDLPESGVLFLRDDNSTQAAF